MALTVTILPILSDNYCYILRSCTGEIAVLDPGDAAPILAYLQDDLHKVTHVINTHKHWDHTNGNAELLKACNAKIAAPKEVHGEVHGADIILNKNNPLIFAGHHFDILETPCHTAGHICLYCAQDRILFTGDTLFALGCGRFFEGDASDMFAAFELIRALPDETLIYCGHEYTASNAKFALHVDPDNKALQQRARDIQALRANNKPTIPFSLADEKATNPFLRATSSEALATLRQQKDQF